MLLCFSFLLGDFFMDEKNEKDLYEDLAIEHLVYENNYSLNILLDLLIEKGIISEKEFKDKLNSVIEESQNTEEVDIKELTENID